MNTVLFIAMRDVRERSRLFFVAAVLACLPFFAILLPASRGRETLAGFGGFIALGVGYALAFGLGVTTFGRELTERRLSFWYSKPISPAALWIGRAGAAIFSAFVCAAIVALPAMIVAGGLPLMTPPGQEWKAVLAFAGAILVLFLAGHAVSTMFRSRSLLLGLDLLCALTAAAILLLLLRPVAFTAAFWPLAFAIGVALVVVFAVAPYWQLRAGRADAKRSHAAFSRAVWSGVAIVLALTASAVFWLAGRTSPADLEHLVSFDQAPGGSAVFVWRGSARRGGMAAMFAVDPRTGDFERLFLASASPENLLISRTLCFSRDGRFAAWAEPAPFRGSQGRIVIRDLTTGENQVIRMESGRFPRLAFSDDGRRLAVQSERSRPPVERSQTTLSVLDRASGTLMMEMPLDWRTMNSFWFVTPDILRVVSGAWTGDAAGSGEIAEIDLRTKRRTITGRTTGYVVSVSGDGSRMLLEPEGRVVDARTGAAIVTIGRGVSTVKMTAALLEDGRVVWMEPAAEGRFEVRIYSRDGLLLHRLPLPWKHARIVGQRGASQLLIARDVHAHPVRRPDGERVDSAAMLVIDADRGTIVKMLDGMRAPSPHVSGDPRLIVYDASAKLAGVGKDGKLTYWN